MRSASIGVCLGRSRRFLTGAMLSLLLGSGAALPQETNPDPNRVFTTDLHWERVAGAPRSEKLRRADGTLVILYLDGTYAEVRASFIKTGGKVSVGLNLNEGFVVRLGTWSRTEDEVLIRTVSREVRAKRLCGWRVAKRPRTVRFVRPCLNRRFRVRWWRIPAAWNVLLQRTSPMRLSVRG